MFPYFCYWAKTDNSGIAHHSIPCHSLDVAAVAHAILEQDAGLRERMSRLLPFSPSTLPFFLALHDVGKFSPRFQWFVPELARRLQPDARRVPENLLAKDDYHHTSIGQWLWNDLLWKLTVSALGCAAPEEGEFVLAPLAATVFGHHGRPAMLNQNYLDERFRAEDKEAVQAFVLALADLLLKEEDPFALDEDAETNLQRASWDIAGFTVLCDWIGSNERWFPPCPGADDMRVYYEKEALPQAYAAVEQAGVVPPRPSGATGWPQLFPSLADKQPSPLQEHASKVELPDGPQLHILEDLTGSGKTEAALLLAARLMAAGHADGFTFALPTMATANSMYSRLGEQAHRLFADDAARPSLMLAHGARGLHDQFLRSVELENIPPGARNPDGTGAEAHCAAWLADNRKKALLAPAGACTLDQALLGALPVRHQALRLFGLGRYVLIADEIHAYDPYVTGLLKTLLTLHASRGGSAILLSATLPRRIRDQLTAAFQEGCGTRPKRMGLRRVGAGSAPNRSAGAPAIDPYPSATLAAENGASKIQKVKPAPWSPREVEVEHVTSSELVRDRLAEASGAGACGAYIRNTVDDALAAWEALRSRTDVDPDKVILLHARFALGDRLHIEQDITSHFGKLRKDEAMEDKLAGRAGWVVVSTQVCEMSLDLCLDVMASDLAPMDALLQRLGRLHRHAFRRPPGYQAKRLLLHAPPWEDNPAEDWYGARFERAQWVYRLHGRLWLTLRELLRRGILRLPQDARELVEAVYSPEADREVPAKLTKRDAEFTGEDLAKASFADFAALNPHLDYGDQQGWHDAEEVSTRQGENTTTLRLATLRDGRICPWFAPKDGTPHEINKAWSLSELRVRQSLLKTPFPPRDTNLRTHLEALDAHQPDWNRHVVLLEERDGGHVFDGVSGKGDLRSFRYDRRSGLRLDD